MSRTRKPRRISRLPAVFGVAVATAGLVLVPTGAAVAAPARVLGYVANSGGGVSVFDASTNTVSSTIADPDGNSPYNVGVAFDGARGYVTNLLDNSLTVIDTPTGTVDANIAVGAHPAGVVVAPEGGHVYVTNYADGTVSVVDVALGATTATIPVGPNADGIAITPNGKTLYVAHDVVGPGTVSVVDTATNAEVAEVPTGNTPTAVAVTPDGGRVLVVNKFSDNVAVLATATNTVVGTIPVSYVPHGVAISPDGARAYVTNSEGDSLSVLDIPAMAVVGSVPVGDRPIGVSLNPDGSRAYVANYNTGTVSVVDTATLGPVASMGVGPNPVGVAVHAVPAAPTKLVAGSAVLQLRLLAFGVKGLNAKLTESHTGRAVVGAPVVFTTVKGNPLCSAKTDATGVARCDAVVPLLVGLATLLQGYTASHAGTPEHGPSTSHGALRLL